jgi:hypothetical protein
VPAAISITPPSATREIAASRVRASWGTRTRRWAVAADEPVKSRSKPRAKRVESWRIESYNLSERLFIHTLP